MPRRCCAKRSVIRSCSISSRLSAISLSLFPVANLYHKNVYKRRAGGIFAGTG